MLSKTVESKQQELSKKIADNLSHIKHKILVMSGKGGVGKSTMSVNIAASLAAQGYSVGLLDVDFHGPSIPTLLGLQQHKSVSDENGIKPAISFNIKVVSIAFLLNGNDDAVIWRGPMKMGAISQLIGEVNWGELDYLIIDSPPGTGDEPLSVCQTIKNLDGAIIITTPQQLSIADVKRSVNFCRQLKTPILGIIENMSGFLCPNCSKIIDIFKSGGGEELAKTMNMRFLGKVPLDPAITESADSGQIYLDNFKQTKTAEILQRILKQIPHLPELNCF